MSTQVHFIGNEKIQVQEEPSQIASEINTAGGLPFRLRTMKGKEIWVNPTTIMYWLVQGPAQVRGLQ